LPVADLLRGHKELAAAAGRPVRTCQELVATYPDPLPAKRFRGRIVWARHERVALWARRHPIKGAPDPTLPKVDGWFAIARFVRLAVPTARQLAPWSSLAGRDPLPVDRDNATGRVWAYRDALLDWLDRQSEPAASPRRRRKWGKAKVRAAKRLRSEAELRVATGDRVRPRGTGPQHACQESAKERRAA
jgi:hypothetical protein